MTNNYEELKLICKKISRLEDVDDLLHSCVLQFLSNKKVVDIPEPQRLFFFAKIVRNNYNSKSSPYYHQYTKHQFNELGQIEIPEVEYEEKITLDWVKNQINILKKEHWYFGRLMELYLEEGCSITKLARRTTIPINSVSRDINKVRKILRQKRNNELL